MNAFLEGRDDQFVVTPYVVAEVAYLVQKFAGPAAEIQFVEAVRDGVFHQEELSGPDLDRVVELMRRFRDFPLGVADASIIAVAERLKICEIASMDGHFRAVRPHGIDFSRCCRRRRHGAASGYTRWPIRDRPDLGSFPVQYPLVGNLVA